MVEGDQDGQLSGTVVQVCRQMRQRLKTYNAVMLIKMKTSNEATERNGGSRYCKRQKGRKADKYLKEGCETVLLSCGGQQMLIEDTTRKTERT